MNWLFGYRRLKRLGVLGINRRNAVCILERNPRSRFAVVDDKVQMAELCARIGVATPMILGIISQHAELRLLHTMLLDHNEFVMKPACGSGGRGIVVIAGRDGAGFRRANGRSIDLDGLRAHGSDVLSGLFSLGGQPDRLLLQKRICPNRAFAGVAPCGLPDVRIILYRFEPAMAMLRLPTLASGGRANLHQGGICAGVDLASGRTTHAIFQERSVSRHPDTGKSLLHLAVPNWSAVVEMARKTARAVGLGFVGIDIVLDEHDGPLLLEANARPGLTIQLANNGGLQTAIDEIDLLYKQPNEPAADNYGDHRHAEPL
jgi:alpha-L-glutamate ligase-like protein